MALNEHQKRALLTNLARDKAETLRNEILRAAAEAKAQQRPDLSEEQRRLGEYAMQRALDSAQRLVANLERAMELAQEMASEAGESGGGDHRSGANDLPDAPRLPLD